MTQRAKQPGTDAACIVQVIADGRPGGGTTAVLTLSQLLARRGCDVVLISQEGSYLVEQARACGLRAHGLDFASRLNTLKIAMQLSRHFDELKPAVVHAHGARAGLPVALVARLRAGAQPKRLVYTVHGFHYLRKPPGLYQLARAAEALCIAQADCTNFVSDGDRLIAEREGLLKRARAHGTIKNAVPVDHGLGASPKVHDIGFLGRLCYQKNPLLLLDILKAMRPLRPTLSVIGGGPLEAALRTRIREEGLGEQVLLQGERSRTEALRLASSCRVLVLPSRWEGHPIALIEAMHLGLPVVASAVSGSNEIVADGETGYLVPAQDAGAYALALARLLEDGQARQAMERNARRRSAREYSPERMVAAHMELYGVSSGAAASVAVPVMS